MLWTKAHARLRTVAQMATSSQAALLFGLGHAATQTTGRQPREICHRKRTGHLPNDGGSRRRLINLTHWSLSPRERRFQNVQTPGARTPVRAVGVKQDVHWQRAARRGLRAL